MTVSRSSSISSVHTADLISALRCASAYPDPPRAPVKIVQTHISILFFTDRRVYKVKKPVKFDFLDYSTAEKRRHFCEEEVRLNRRLAPNVYRGVVPIVHGNDGTIRINATGEVVEYAVEMLRLPDGCMMAEMLDRGEIDNAKLDSIIGILARFHQTAATGPGVDEFGQSDEITRQVEENFRGLEASARDDAMPFGGTSFGPSAALYEHLLKTVRTWLADHSALMEKRVRDGRIREGHGDLHSGNICMTDGDVVIYDCIEFSRRFRCRDVACELAFLAMDLDLRCFRGFAQYMLHRYASWTNDPELPAVAAFYKLHLALVRGKVVKIRAADPNLDAVDREQSRLESMRYFHLAGAYSLPPVMMLMCGLPASGKSYAARLIARPFEAIVLRSDVVRKELAGRFGPPSEQSNLGAGIYSPEFTRLTYTTLLDRAQGHLKHDRTVIVDATFSSAAMRRPFFEAACQLGVPCLLVETICPEEMIRARLTARAHDTDEASDADWEVYRHAKRRFESPEEIPPAHRMQIESGHAAEDTVSAVMDGLVRLCRPTTPYGRLT